jgi:hypothetical protein
LTVSLPASRFVAARGGRLFVWSVSVARSWAVLSASTRPPPDVLFEVRDVDGIELLVEADLELPHRIAISLALFPRPHLAVSTDA